MSSENSDIEEKLEELAVEKEGKEKEINILLIGETGIGKSTFINSVANYITYKYLDKAEKRKPIILIPSVFTVKDKNDDLHVIKVGSEQNETENLQTGVSATQVVTPYVFPIWKWQGKVKVRFIDTPGIGDTRGIEQDEANCDYIFKYVSQLNKLHAICFLFKPTNARKTIFFEYCLSQILCRLEKCAYKNIYFVFTNTRASDYSCGDTLPTLEKCIEEINKHLQGFGIPLKKSNIFCFDNEGFRYLSAVEQNIEFSKSTTDNYKDSWEKSAKECWKFIKTIQNENPPYFPIKLSTITEARKVIIKLLQVINNITQRISDIHTMLQRLLANRSSDSEELTELKKKQFVPVTTVDRIILTEPELVCTSLKCADVYKVQDEFKWHFKTVCHTSCTEIPNAQKDTIGCPELVNCFFIIKQAGEERRICSHCGCDFLVHMLTEYRTRLKEDQVIDQSVIQEIENKESILQSSLAIINDISRKIYEFEKERNMVITVSITLLSFLRTHSMLPFNKCAKEYVNHLIMQKQSVGDSYISSSIETLKRLFKDYESCEQLFKENLVVEEAAAADLSKADIDRELEKLFALKHHGSDIRKIFEGQINIVDIEEPVQDYVHEIKFDKSDFKKTKIAKGDGKDKTKANQKDIRKHEKEDKGKSKSGGKGSEDGRQESRSRDKSRDKREKKEQRDKRDQHYKTRNVDKGNDRSHNQEPRRLRTPPPPYTSHTPDTSSSNQPYPPGPSGHYYYPHHAPNYDYYNQQDNRRDTSAAPHYEVKVSINKNGGPPTHSSNAYGSYNYPPSSSYGPYGPPLGPYGHQPPPYGQPVPPSYRPPPPPPPYSGNQSATYGPRPRPLMDQYLPPHPPPNDPYRYPPNDPYRPRTSSGTYPPPLLRSYVPPPSSLPAGSRGPQNNKGAQFKSNNKNDGNTGRRGNKGQGKPKNPKKKPGDDDD